MLIPPEKQAELRERYNPDGSTLREFQLRLLDILKYIDTVCQRENIPYWLTGGNVLGHVRHGGFIPWDDDIDIEIEEHDYKRLRKAILNDPDSPYQWQDHTTDGTYIMHFAKLRDLHSQVEEDWTDYYKYKGAFIDIFPMGKTSPRFIRFTTKLRGLHERLIWHRLYPKSLRRLSLNLLRIWLQRCLFPLGNLFCRPFANADKLYQTPSSVARDFTARDRNLIFPLQRIAFEGVETNAPCHMEEILTALYGDWQKVPDPSNIHLHFDPSKVKLY